MNVEGVARRYTPLDQVLELRTVRILRALRHFDWATSREIATVLEVVLEDWYLHSAALRNLVRRGHVTRRGHSRMTMEYRLTDAGRVHLEAQLRRGML